MRGKDIIQLTLLEITPAWSSAFPGAYTGILSLREAGSPARTLTGLPMTAPS